MSASRVPVWRAPASVWIVRGRCAGTVLGSVWGCVHAESVARRLNVSLQVIGGASHQLMEEVPGAVNDALRRLIENRRAGDDRKSAE